MYNLYVAEKRQKEADEREKVRKTYDKYRKRFKSKKIFSLIINKNKISIIYRTNPNNV